MGRHDGTSGRSVEEMCESADPQSPVEHLIVCPSCGQMFDCRLDDEVSYHVQPGHKPKLD